MKNQKNKKDYPLLNWLTSSSGEEETATETTEEVKKVSWVKLLGYKQTWAFAFGKFMTDGVWWFFLFWLPAYLKAQYGIVDKAVMLPLAVLYTVCDGWQYWRRLVPGVFYKKGIQGL